MTKSLASICRHCHRLKAVNAAQYCVACDQELRARERRRPKPTGVDDGRPTAGALEPEADSGPLYILAELEDDPLDPEP